ncbi:MAG TPA: type II toxin-antitoxin system HicB family antitoxin [Candidatus Babeliales bacterium]|nr:type II toxin-antitoxin system HicB family antitoxin [Candidatus Babeliales bacterium]
MPNKIKDINYYLNLPWTYTIETTKETGELLYIVHVNELPGIATDAPSLETAMSLIKEAMTGALELYLKQGDVIPEPIDPEEFKGNIAYRTSSSRHYKLFKEAQKRNQSLSQFIDQCIDLALRK